jgi:hypothetical protein
MSKIYLQLNKEISAKEFVMPIYLDTEGESINAFEVRLKFSSNLIFRDYLEKDSIVSYWIEKPQIQENNLVFSGIIPGGYIGKKGLLVNLVFEAKSESQSSIEILPSSQVLLNDGFGTKADLKIEKYEFLVKPSEKKEIVIKDNYPPESFKIYLQRNKEIFDGKYYIIFDAKDKQSGIAYYEVKEGKYDFEKAKSPYVLKDQSLRSYIYVKAVDRAGNERIEVLKSLKLFLPEEIFFIFLFLIIGTFLIKLVLGYGKKDKQ